MERINVMYITEEEKRAILRQRLEAERKANKRRLTEHERTHRIMGVLMLIMAIVTLVVFGAEGIVMCILCTLFSIMGFSAREEAREEWTDR